MLLIAYGVKYNTLPLDKQLILACKPNNAHDIGSAGGLQDLLNVSHGRDSSVPNERWKEWMPEVQFQ